MGTLFYGAALDPIAMPDLVLAHLQALASAKLRRSESFTVTWHHPAADGPGKTAIWFHPAVALRFVFEVADTPLDRATLHRFAAAASTSAGLVIDISADLPVPPARALQDA